MKTKTRKKTKEAKNKQKASKSTKSCTKVGKLNVKSKHPHNIIKTMQPSTIDIQIKPTTHRRHHNARVFKLPVSDTDTEDFHPNFDLVTPEGDAPDKNSLWGLPVREFVPDTVISWVEHLQDEEPIYWRGDNVLRKVMYI